MDGFHFTIEHHDATQLRMVGVCLVTLVCPNKSTPLRKEHTKCVCCSIRIITSNSGYCHTGVIRLQAGPWNATTLCRSGLGRVSHRSTRVMGTSISVY